MRQTPLQSMTHLWLTFCYFNWLQLTSTDFNWLQLPQLTSTDFNWLQLTSTASTDFNWLQLTSTQWLVSGCDWGGSLRVPSRGAGNPTKPTAVTLTRCRWPGILLLRWLCGVCWLGNLPPRDGTGGKDVMRSIGLPFLSERNDDYIWLLA